MRRSMYSCIAAAVLASSLAFAVSAGQDMPKSKSGMGNKDGMQSVEAKNSEELSPFQQVDIDGLKSSGLFSGEPLKIKGYVLEAGTGTGTKGPAAVLSPSCGGPLGPSGLVRPSYSAMARMLKEMGITSVLVDGFNPRGRVEVCTQNPKVRSIDTDTRIKDSLAGLRYLRGRADIDGSRVFLVTWGAAGSMETMITGLPDIEKVGGGFRAAVMFFPQCDRVDGTFAPYNPIQVFVGEQDAWNPASYCLSLLQRKQPSAAAMDVKIYPDTFHGFDLPIEPKPVTNAVVTNVMVGGNPAARADAYARTKAFFAQFIDSQ